LKRINWIATLVLSIVFVFLFYNQSPGYNVLVFSVLFVISDGFINKSNNQLVWLFRIAVVAMATFYCINQSTSSFWMLFISWALLYAAHGIQHSKNLLLLLAHWPFIWFGALQLWVLKIINSPKALPIKNGFRKTGIWLIPMLAVLGFFLLYLAGSEFVADSTQKSINTIFDAFDAFFKKLALGRIDNVWFGLFILGLLISSSLMASVYDAIWPKWDNYSYRQHEEISVTPTSVHKSIVIFLIAINILLAWVVWLEIKNIWFGFSWQGELLKGFVHQGTYALIVSIFLAVFALAFIFNKLFQHSTVNTNKHILPLALLWIVLNILMVVSVCIRNYWYIHYFGLAYKRIGLFFFLAICLMGLFFIFWMIIKKHHPQFLVKSVAFGAYLLLLLMAAVNWDKQIAKYNLTHYHQAYLYAPLLLELDDKVLPILQLNEKKISTIEAKQKEIFPFVYGNELTNLGYKLKINNRIVAFKVRFEKKNWLSKTWAEQKAYSQLKE
jgi:hypothetical protein